MARTKHQQAVEHLVATALALQTRVNHAAVFDTALQPLADAVDTLVLARGNVATAVTFTQTVTTPASRAAAVAALHNRSKWQPLVYEAIYRTATGMTDEQIELTISAWRRTFHSVICGHANGAIVRIPSEPKHQTISSARNALVALGLVRANGEITVGTPGRRHTLWAVVP